MKTAIVKKSTLPGPQWHLIDAKGQILGRLATRVATLLRGKHKATFTPNIIMGDCVVVINASQIKVTGKKLSQKIYHRHSGYPGNMKDIPLEKQLTIDPREVIILAVKRMLPQNKLRPALLNRLKVFPGAEHAHTAQQPKPLKL